MRSDKEIEDLMKIIGLPAIFSSAVLFVACSFFALIILIKCPSVKLIFQSIFWSGFFLFGIIYLRSLDLFSDSATKLTTWLGYIVGMLLMVYLLNDPGFHTCKP